MEFRHMLKWSCAVKTFFWIWIVHSFLMPQMSNIEYSCSKTTIYNVQRCIVFYSLTFVFLVFVCMHSFCVEQKVMLFQYWVQQTWMQCSFSVAFLQLSHYRGRLYLVWGFVLRMNNPNPCQLNFEWYWKNSNSNKSKQRKKRNKYICAESYLDMH